MGRNDAFKFTPNDLTNIPVSKCPTSAGYYKKGNRGFGQINSTDFFASAIQIYVLFCEFQVKSCFLLIVV